MLCTQWETVPPSLISIENRGRERGRERVQSDYERNSDGGQYVNRQKTRAGIPSWPRPYVAICHYCTVETGWIKRIMRQLCFMGTTVYGDVRILMTHQNLPLDEQLNISYDTCHICLSY